MADVLDTEVATASLIVFGSLLVELRIPSVPHSIQQAVMLLDILLQSSRGSLRVK